MWISKARERNQPAKKGSEREYWSPETEGFRVKRTKEWRSESGRIRLRMCNRKRPSSVPFDLFRSFAA
ncbi:unnamed protein product [Calypogeia fissa]